MSKGNDTCLLQGKAGFGGVCLLINNTSKGTEVMAKLIPDTMTINEAKSETTSMVQLVHDAFADAEFVWTVRHGGLRKTARREELVGELNQARL